MAIFDKIISSLEEVLVSIALGIATILTFLEVVLRYGFGSSLGITFELTTYLLIFVGFIGASIGVRDKVHIGVELLVEKFPYKVQKILGIATILISAWFCITISYLGMQQVGVMAALGQVTPEMEIPLTVPLSIVPLGFLLMTFRFLQEAVKLVRTPADELGKKEGVH